MQTRQIQEFIPKDAVKKLRIKKLRLGYPFMINSNALPLGQCYLEYPSGIIKLAALSASKRDFEIIRELNKEETLAIRNKYNLY
jgi:hypothetical protein